MEKECCPLCYRMIGKTGDGRFVPHVHTPLMADVCEGSKKTKTEAEQLRTKLIEAYRSKKGKT